MSAYLDLENRFAHWTRIQDAAGILMWDSQTVMPAGAAEARSSQIATLRVIAHEMLTDHALPALLDTAGAESLSPWQEANLRAMRREWLQATAVPSALVGAASRAASACEMAWRTARPAGDFAALRPFLEEVLTCQRAVGQARAAALNCTPYEALLDLYEPGLRLAELEPFFATLAGALPALLSHVLERQVQRPPTLPLPGQFPLPVQQALARRVMTAAGFDFNSGRLDESLHPFTGGANGDVRITTRYDARDPLPGLMGVLHETGHGLYEQGRPQAWQEQPVGAARGMAVHESQSLMLEMQAGRSRAFAAFLAPLLQETFDGHGLAWTPENLWHLLTRVRPGPIRVDADEVTYPAHILVRYRLERALIEDDLAVVDLPDAWNSLMGRLVGVAPPDDRLGCLQDIHWPGGDFGYFPAYTLGAAMAAQLYQAALAAEPGIPDALTRGDFAPLTGWLRTHIHSQGSRLDTRDLLIRATGQPLSAAPYLAHLRRRYLDEET